MAGQNRDKIVDAFLALLAEQPFEKVDLRAIAQRAEISLADLRREFNSVFDVLAAFVRSTDEKLLAEGFDPELSGTPARERLFEVLMQRIEILKPHRAAMRSIARSARGNLPFALALNGLALRSAQWMLSAAEIDSGGLQGCVRAQGLVVVMARTYRVWLDDEDPGLARTMAALDRELANGERALGLIGNLCRFVPRFGGGSRRRRRGMDNETAAA
jgi:AcrR family transcriptional regulator